jgi:hypothetical protein
MSSVRPILRRGGATRLIGNLAVRQPGWNANLYVQYYDWAMSSNPTYAQADGTSAQIDQFDRRWIIGLTARRHWDVGSRLRLTVGTENRYDHIGNVGVNRTADRVFLRSLGHYHVEEASGALYGEATWQPVSGLRLTGGLRGDYYHYTVRARDGAAALLGTGSGHDPSSRPKSRWPTRSCRSSRSMRTGGAVSIPTTCAGRSMWIPGAGAGPGHRQGTGRAPATGHRVPHGHVLVAQRGQRIAVRGRF